MRNWVLHVKNFGKIKSADVEVKPLTLFVGDNNSGKSYLLSLIWSLKNYATLPLVFVNYEKELKNSYYESLKSQLKELLNNDDSSKEFLVETQSFLHFLNNQLKIIKILSFAIFLISKRYRLMKLAFLWTASLSV